MEAQDLLVDGGPSQNSPLTEAVVSLRAMSGKETVDDLVRKIKLSHPTTQRYPDKPHWPGL